MRISSILLAASALALAACGDSTTVEDPSDPDQVAAAIEGIAKPQPGEYQTTVELLEFAIPGASAEELAAMRQMVEAGAEQGQSFCMTQQEADAGYQEFLESMQNSPDECEFSNFSVDGDALNATMMCDDGAGNTGTINFGGTITESSQDMTVTMDMANAGEGQSMRMVLRNQTERVGECSEEGATG